MKLKNLIRYHKNTITGVISVILFSILTYQWITGAVTPTEYFGLLAGVGGVVSTLVAFISPDGKNEAVRQENRQAIIDEVKAQLKQENEKAIPGCNCGTPADCVCVLKKGPDQL